MNHELYLPLPGEATAPFFDKAKPRELLRFFEHLDRLYSRFALEDEEKKKRYMVGYTDWETEECWKTFPEYGDSTAAYSDFKKAIMRIYPSSNASTLYTIRDMEHLISKRQRLGITTCDDLANFHTAYFGLTQWLISKGYISKQEQQRGYMQAIPQSLIPAVTTRLQIVHPLHNPLLPYEVDAIFEATRFALRSCAEFFPAYFATRQPAQPAQIAAATSQSRTSQRIASLQVEVCALWQEEERMETKEQEREEKKRRKEKEREEEERRKEKEQEEEERRKEKEREEKKRRKEKEREEEERRKEKEREEKKRWKEKEREEEEVRVKAEQGLAPAIPIIATSSEHPFVTTKDAAYAPLLPQVIGQQQKLDVIAPACEEAATYGLERREERKVDVWEDIWSLAKDWKAEEEENAKIQADTTNHSYDTILAELSAIRIWAPQPPSNILERSSMVLNPASVFHISKSQAHSIPPSSAISGAPIHELSQHSHPSAVILVSALDACMSPVHASPHNSSLPVAPVERKHSLATENISANLRTIRDSKGIVRTIKTVFPPILQTYIDNAPPRVLGLCYIQPKRRGRHHRPDLAYHAYTTARTPSPFQFHFNAPVYSSQARIILFQVAFYPFIGFNSFSLVIALFLSFFNRFLCFLFRLIRICHRFVMTLHACHRIQWFSRCKILAEGRHHRQDLGYHTCMTVRTPRPFQCHFHAPFYSFQGHIILFQVTFYSFIRFSSFSLVIALAWSFMNQFPHSLLRLIRICHRVMTTPYARHRVQWFPRYNISAEGCSSPCSGRTASHLNIAFALRTMLHYYMIFLILIQFCVSHCFYFNFALLVICRNMFHSSFLSMVSLIITCFGHWLHFISFFISTLSARGSVARSRQYQVLMKKTPFLATFSRKAIAQDPKLFISRSLDVSSYSITAFERALNHLDTITYREETLDYNITSVRFGTKKIASHLGHLSTISLHSRCALHLFFDHFNIVLPAWGRSSIVLCENSSQGLAAPKALSIARRRFQLRIHHRNVDGTRLPFPDHHLFPSFLFLIPSTCPSPLIFPFHTFHQHSHDTSISHHILGPPSHQPAMTEDSQYLSWGEDDRTQETSRDVNAPFSRFHNLCSILADAHISLRILADHRRSSQIIADHRRSSQVIAHTRTYSQLIAEHLQIIADTCSHHQYSHYHLQLPAVLAIIKHDSNNHSGDCITHHLYFYLVPFIWLLSPMFHYQFTGSM